jgi:sulfonate transport system permease protein
VSLGVEKPVVSEATGGSSANTGFPGKRYLGWIVPLLVASAIELGVRSGLVSRLILPSPWEIATTLFELAGRDLHLHVMVSSARVLAGFLIGGSLGLGVAIIVGLNRRAARLLDPTFQGLRAIPGLAWVPLLLLWLGIDEKPKVTMIAIGVFFPVYLNTVAGLRNVDRKLFEVGEIHGLSRLASVRRILLPGALPQIFVGIRVGLSLAWMLVVAAELIAATRGIGYLLTDGREISRPDIVLAAIVILGILGKLSDTLLKILEKRLLAWRDVMDSNIL